MTGNISYGLASGLLLSAVIIQSRETWLAGVVCLTIAICTTRILSALEKRPS